MDLAYRQFHKLNNARLPFFATLANNNQMKTLENSTRLYVAQQRIKYNQAVQQNISHIAIHGEV